MQPRPLLLRRKQAGECWSLCEAKGFFFESQSSNEGVGLDGVDFTAAVADERKPEVHASGVGENVLSKVTRNSAACRI